MKARCPTCFALVLVAQEDPKRQTDHYWIDGHDRLVDGKKARCPGSDTLIAAMKLEGYR